MRDAEKDLKEFEDIRKNACDSLDMDMFACEVLPYWIIRCVKAEAELEKNDKKYTEFIKMLSGIVDYMDRCPSDYGFMDVNYDEEMELCKDAESCKECWTKALGLEE